MLLSPDRLFRLLCLLACLFAFLLVPTFVSAADDAAEVSSQDTSPATNTSSPSAFRGYVGVFSGSGGVKDTTVDAQYQCFFCAPVSVSKQVAFDEGDIQVIRLGGWGDARWPHAGFASEMGRAEAKSNDATFNYNYFAFIPMLRTPLMTASAAWRGGVNLYAGFAIIVVMDGEGAVNDAAFPRTVSGPLKGNGQAMMLGAVLDWGRLSFSLEQRQSRTKLSFSEYGDGGSARLSSAGTLLGIAARF